MKFRYDFVTNSSSSSFIMAFKSKETIRDEMIQGVLEKFVNPTADVLGKVMFAANDIINNAKPETREEIINRVCEDYQERILSDYVFDRYYQPHRYHLPEYKSYSECYDALTKDDDFMETIKERVNELRQRMTDATEGNTYFVEVEYADEDGDFMGSLEHEIMPYLPNTIQSISHH